MTYETLSEIEWEKVGRIWDLLDDGHVERARIELDALLGQRPAHPDLKIVDAAVALDEGDPERAARTLQGAERSADPALFFHLRAACRFELAAFAAARDDAERSLAIRSDTAETHDLMSRALDHLGDHEGSRHHAQEAHELAPDNFPPVLEVTDDEFDRLVEASIKELPEQVRRHLGELPILVEPLPRREILTSDHPPLSPDILGLFVGRHLMERQHDETPTGPGAIFLFRRNLLRVSADREELAHEIRVTVQHEVGHLLGLDEDDLDQWGLA